MSRLLPADFAGFDAAISGAQPQRCLRLVYAAAPAAGTVYTLISAQYQATPRQFFMVGSGSASLTLAQAQSICAPIDSSTIQQDPQRLNLAVGLVTYFTNIAATKAGFLIGGLQINQVQDAFVRIRRYSNAGAVNPATEVPVTNPSTAVGGPQLIQPYNQPVINLNGSNQLLAQDGTTAITAALNPLCYSSYYHVVWGAATFKYTGDNPAAGDFVDLYVFFS